MVGDDRSIPAMEKGFLAREDERTPPMIINSSSNEAPKGDAELQRRFNEILSESSQPTQAFFEHDAIEVDYETALGKRDPLTTSLRQVESPRKKRMNVRGRSDQPRSPIHFDEIFAHTPPRCAPTFTSGPTLSQNRPGPSSESGASRVSPNPYVCGEWHADTTEKKTLRQVSLSEFLRPRKTRVKRKPRDKKHGDLTSENYPGAIIIPPVTRSSGLLLNAVTIESAPNPPQLPKTPRSSSLEDDFIVRIELEPSEEKLLARFKYMFDSAVENLSHAPPFPDGLVPFQASMLEVQSDSTTSHSEHLMLSQALHAGRSAIQVYQGEVLDSTQRIPEWARLPPSLPGTFLKKLAEFLLQKTMLVVVPGACLDELSALSRKLRALGVAARDSSEQLPWYTVKGPGAWLVSDALCFGPAPQKFFDGAILAKGAQKVPGLPCGTLRIDMDPELLNLKPIRTAFVDSRLENLTRRLSQAGAVKVDNKPLHLYGVDLCSGNFGIIFNDKEFTDDANAAMFTKLLSRVLRAAYFFRKLVILNVICSRSMDGLEKLIRFVEARGIQTDCDIQVVDCSNSPVQEMVRHYCEIKGDDLADFAFLTLRNSALANIMNEGDPTQNPHTALISVLL